MAKKKKCDKCPCCKEDPKTCGCGKCKCGCTAMCSGCKKCVGCCECACEKEATA
jgi:hypothetical protein